jgi:hypothetical protein
MLTEGKKRKRMGAQKKVKKSNESINSRLALVMKSGKLLGPYSEGIKETMFWIRIRMDPH